MTSERFIYCQLCCIQQSFNLWHAVACKTAKWYGIRETTPRHTFLKTSGVKHITFSNIIKKKGKGFLGGCFLCFQFTFTAETAFEIFYEDFTYWETAVFFVVGNDESTMFLWSWKSGQTLGFTKGKGENQGLVLWTAELIQYQIATPQEDRRVWKSDFSTYRTRTVLPVRTRVLLGYYGNKGMQWALGIKTPPTPDIFGRWWAGPPAF